MHSAATRTRTCSLGRGRQPRCSLLSDLGRSFPARPVQGQFSNAATLSPMNCNVATPGQRFRARWQIGRHRRRLVRGRRWVLSTRWPARKPGRSPPCVRVKDVAVKDVSCQGTRGLTPLGSPLAMAAQASAAARAAASATCFLYACFIFLYTRLQGSWVAGFAVRPWRRPAPRRRLVL